MKKDLLLTRDEMTGYYAAGLLRIDDLSFNTIENPWMDNFPFLSCVPFDSYDLVPVVSPRWGYTFALVNEDIGVFLSEAKANDAGWPTLPDLETASAEYENRIREGADDSYKWARYGVLLHIANWAKNVEGCIGVGVDRKGPVNSPERMVTSSGSAMTILLNALSREETHAITIRSIRHVGTAH